MAINLSTVSRKQRLIAPRIVLYGDSGAGKTMMASEAPNPLFLMAEDSQRFLSLARVPEEDVFQTWQEFMEALTAVHEQDHDFTEIVIDRLDFVERLAVNEVLRQDKKESIADQKAYGFGAASKRIDEVMSPMLDLLDRIRLDKGITVILVCDQTIRQVNDPDVEPYSRHEINMSKDISTRVRGWSDFILFLKKKVRVVKDDAGFNKKHSRAQDRSERVICTDGNSSQAKSPLPIPQEIPAPYGEAWNAFQTAVNEALETSN